ncbi:MAG: metal ABC transporter permease [Nitrospirae bacterium]|nr:metal ABC transporter permease [Nitrospirota bacterium]
MTDLLTYGFMQRALAASVMIGTLCAVVGVFVVLRGLAFVGAGTAHSAFAGVTLGYLVGINPMAMALVFGLGTIWIVQALNERSRTAFDVSVGIFYAASMALAIVFIGLMRTYNSEVYGYLFGSILSVTPSELWTIGLLSAVALTCLALFFKEFHFIAFDQEMAAASGIPATRLFFLLLNLVGLTIVIALKAVGALLVFALLIIPAAAAYQLASRLWTMILWAVGVGLTSTIGGLLLSYAFDLPSGATITLLATALFFLAVLASPKR